MKTVDIVVGANYGDEGKGLFTDYLASKYNYYEYVTVVRHNGGAQAGHTVVLPDGRRHVHHHFASGALCGHNTWLSRHFVCNPIIFKQELAEINVLLDPERDKRLQLVNVDHRCMVTTPFDMLINQLVEKDRGFARHGSCGAGFSETIERCGLGNDRFSTTVSNLDSMNRKSLRVIREEWLPERLRRLGVAVPAPELWETVHDEGVIDQFLEDVAVFQKNTSIRSSKPDGGEHLIFEGAQGLALDQHRGHFPHVTRSNTGIYNALQCIPRSHEAVPIDVWYCTRPYLTRHGNGPLPGESVGYIKAKDETNVWNSHQGNLRYAPLDVKEMGKRIRRDFQDVDRPASAHIAVSCMDHTGGVDGIPFLSELRRVVFDYGCPQSETLASWGPCRNDVQVML